MWIKPSPSYKAFNWVIRWLQPQEWLQIRPARDLPNPENHEGKNYCFKTQDFGLICYTATITKIIQNNLSFPWKIKSPEKWDFFFRFCKQPAVLNLLFTLVQYTVSISVKWQYGKSEAICELMNTENCVALIQSECCLLVNHFHLF